MTHKKNVWCRVDWLVAALALALVCTPPRSSSADEKSDLIGKIEDKLEDASDALERLPDDNHDGAIDRARSLVAEARRYADELGRIAADDDNAKRIADDFEDHQDDFDDAMGSLRILKAGQRVHDIVVNQCTERDKEIVRIAKDFEARNDPDGLTDLPREAIRLQTLTRQQLDELKRHDEKMEDWLDAADDFRADGPWNDLASTVSQTARRTFELWRRGHEAAQSACDKVARGAEHPDVKDALGKLGVSAGGRKVVIEELEKHARELGGVLSGVSEDSGMGSIERAKSLLLEIERGVETLGRIATTDKAAKLILEKWPEGIKQLREALDDLEDLKQHQYDMDALPAKCEAKERELQDMIARTGDDPDGINEIPKFAEALAEPVRAGIVKADERMREEEGDRDRAKAISFSDGPWSDVRAAEQRDADETFQTYEEGYKKTKAECSDVVKGKDAPIVRDAVANLGKTTSSRDELIKEAEAKIDAAARLLNGVAAKQGEGEVASALAVAADLESLLSRLKSAAGNDKRAKEVVERWPVFVEQYKLAVGGLLSLKRAQFELDDLGPQCQREEQALVEFMQQYKDPAGIAAIEARAVATAAAVNTTLQTRRGRMSQMGEWNRGAQAFTLNEGKWAYLSGYVRSAAQGSIDHWSAALAQGEKQCENLTKGVDHPKVKQVIGMLTGRIPPPARHNGDEHDSSCQGVPAGGFCMIGDHCLDGTCTDNRCSRCPSRADGQCHPPGTCEEGDYRNRYNQMKAQCGKERSGNSQMSCAKLVEVCNNAQACVTQRLHVQECFRGGDTRHLEHLNNDRATAQTCEETLKRKRERGECN